LSRAPSPPIEQVPAGVRLHLLIQPRASVSEVTGLHDGRIRIRLAAPPVEGAANKALLKLLAKALGVPLTALTLTKGSSGRRKEVIVSGIPLEKARQVLLQGNR
jgi:hypothetical protein